MADNPIQPENKPTQKPPTRITIKPALKKSETARIDLSTAKPPQSIVDKKDLPANADDYFKRSTMRIELPAAEGKSATARIEIAPGDAAKKQTAKIDLSQAKDAKAKTAPISITPPAAMPGPAPVRPVRPGAMSINRPSAVPGESNIITPVSSPGATDQARKSETARIDLKPEDLERAAVKPKTIRIKRPDGTSGRKPLAIARPAGQPAAMVAPAAEEAAAAGVEAGPGLLAGLSAIAALLVIGVLFYVLMAQTIATDLPFPGKI